MSAADPKQGDPYEQKRYLKSKARQKNQLMRQFVKGDGGTKVNSDAYKQAWARMFGKRTGEHSGDGLNTLVGQEDRRIEWCNDADCWCRS